MQWSSQCSGSSAGASAAGGDCQVVTISSRLIPSLRSVEAAR